MQHLPSLTATQLLADEARQGLQMVSQGEDQTIDGWLRYGSALNEGRKLHPSNNAFHEWLVFHQLGGTHDLDRAAAMWAADLSPGSFHALRRLHPKTRTVRGLHTKWKEARQTQPPKQKLETPTEDERRVVQKLRALVDHPSTDPTVRENAQRKLDTYAARFGEIEPETPKQTRTKEELSAAVTKQALVKATRNQRAFEIIEFAIRQTYGSTDGHLELVLADLKKC